MIEARNLASLLLRPLFGTALCLSLAACQSQGAGYLDTFADGGASAGVDANASSQNRWRAILTPIDTAFRFRHTVAYQGGSLLALLHDEDNSALHTAQIDANGQHTSLTFAAGIHQYMEYPQVAVGGDGGAYLAAYQIVGEPGIHLYRLEGTVWSEVVAAYLPDVFYPISLTGHDNSLAIAAISAAGVPVVKTLDPGTQLWSPVGAVLTDTPVNSVQIASTPTLVATTINSGGSSSSLYAQTGNPWTTVSSDFTGLLVSLELRPFPDGAVILESYPDAVIHRFQSGALSELYRDTEGRGFDGFASDGNFAYTFEFEEISPTAFLRVGETGAERLSVQLENGDALPALPANAPHVSALTVDRGKARFFLRTIAGTEVYELSL